MKKQLAAALTLFITAIPMTEASACYGHNCGSFGNMFTGALVGGMVGALIAPTPQPQQTVVIVMPVPTLTVPIYQAEPAEPEHAYFWWCSSSRQWYPDVRNCSVDWSHR